MRHCVTPLSLPVVAGLSDGKKVEIRSGLNDGDMVVLTGRASLKAGQEVRPKVTAMAAAAGS